MISQCSLCITHSPIHTVEYYTDMALKLIKLGADEICIKDMAGIGRPVSLGKIVANIKAAHPDIPISITAMRDPVSTWQVSLRFVRPAATILT